VGSRSGTSLFRQPAFQSEYGRGLPAVNLAEDGVGERAVVPGEAGARGDDTCQVVEDALSSSLRLVSLDEWGDVLESPAVDEGKLTELLIGWC
jgi:hypothetical protein